MNSFIFLTLILLVINLTVVRLDFDNEEFDNSDSEVIEDTEDVVQQPAEPPIVRREKPTYSVPVPSGKTFFYDAFISASDFQKKWVLSQSKKDGTEDTIAKYDGEWAIEEPADNALVNDMYLILKSKAKHHAVSAKLTKDFVFSDEPLIVQYEVKFQEGQECGGAYIKLLSKSDNLNLIDFNDKTGYTIMFGPDKCGNDHKLHFIFRHKNPITNIFEEKHAKKPTSVIDNYFTDKKTHLYTLVVSPDNTYTIYIDQAQVNYGSLLEDMTPAVNPPAEIIDSNDKKPDDWDEREKIKDPDATKPDDWDETLPEMIPDASAVKPDGWMDDEPELIPDPKSEKPSDWDEDMDGEWEAPMINNPKCESGPGCGEWKRPELKNPDYKGVWSPPMVDNPDYKGKWMPRMIPNPNYFEDKYPFKMTTIAAIGLELWSMSSNIAFDNFIITNSKQVADDFASQSWNIKQAEESLASDQGGVMQSIYEATNERPWMWAVIVVVVVLPVVLLIAYCCSSSKEDKNLKVRKKTDKSSADEAVEDRGEEKEADSEEGEDEGEGGEEVEEPGASAGDAGVSGTEEDVTVRRRTKADLEDKTASNPSPLKPKKKKVPTATLR